MLAQQIIDEPRFDRITTEAIHTVIKTVESNFQAQRWINAIGKAAERIKTQGEFIQFDVETGQLFAWSQGSNNIYCSDETCQCKAFVEFKHPCWHRACARLMQIYLGISPAAAAPLTAKQEQAQAPYLKNTSTRVPEKLGGVRY